jgi:hypothetical protein
MRVYGLKTALFLRFLSLNQYLASVRPNPPLLMLSTYRATARTSRRKRIS